MGTDRKRLTADEQAPFHALVKLVERELELAGQGRLQELQDAVADTGAHIATLPSPPPASALPLALRAEAMRERVRIELERCQERLSVSRLALSRARRIARKYSPPRSGRISTSA